MSVAILIDGNNMYHAVKGISGSDRGILDYDKAIPLLLNNRRLTKLIFFKEGNTMSDKFKNRLKKNFGGKCVSTEFSSDIYIVVDMLKACLLQRVDTIILMSGDGDYCPAVKFVQEIGCRVEVVSAKSSLSPKLKQMADQVYILDKNWISELPEYNSHENEVPKVEPSNRC